MDSDSEEEILIYAEFEDGVNIDSCRNVHVLGIDQKNPVMQLDDTFFTGAYENALGTYMFFEDDPSPSCSDPLFDKLPDKNLKYLCKTMKVVKMEHAYVSNKDGSENNPQQEESKNDDELEQVHFNTLQEALDKFRNEWSPIDGVKTSSEELKMELEKKQPEESKKPEEMDSS